MGQSTLSDLRMMFIEDTFKAPAARSLFRYQIVQSGVLSLGYGWRRAGRAPELALFRSQLAKSRHGHRQPPSSAGYRFAYICSQQKGKKKASKEHLQELGKWIKTNSKHASDASQVVCALLGMKLNKLLLG